MLDYNDTNMKYQFSSQPNSTGKNKINFMAFNQYDHRYHPVSDKGANTTNLNLNMESSHHQNNKYRIDISPVRDAFESCNKYRHNYDGYKKKHPHHQSCHDNDHHAKLEIETSDNLKVNKFNILPLSSRSNNPNLNRMNEFQCRTRKPGK